MKNTSAINKFNDTVNTVLGEFSLEGAVTNILKFHQNDKNYSYSEMIKTPIEIAKQLKNMGLKTDVYKLKSDGKTAYFDCIMPQLWDIYDASLEITSPKQNIQILAEHSKDRFMVPNRCKETPKNGIIGELILESDLDKKSAKGKFVLSFGFPGTAKVKIIEAGAAAMVSGFSESFGEIGDGVFWANGWSQSAGWYHSKDEPRLTTFMLSYNKAKELEKLLKSGKKVMLKGKVDAKTFDGNLKAISSVIPGVSKKELLLVSHMYEPFASDNGDGNAAMLEIARTLSKLIKEKKIPKPKRSIRFLFTFEKYGTSHFFEDKERTKNIFASINFDSMSLAPEFTGYPTVYKFAPVTNPSLFDAFMTEKVNKYIKKDFKTNRATLSDDSFMADPAIGIPNFWIVANSGAKHHNSILKFEESNWVFYRKVYNACTDFLLELLYLDDKLFLEKSNIYLENLNLLNKFEYQKLETRSKKMSKEEFRTNLDFIANWNINRIKAMEKVGINSSIINKMIETQKKTDKSIATKYLKPFSSKTKEVTRPEVDKLDKIIPLRLTKGMPFSLARVPFNERIKNPLESESLTNDTDLLFSWMDGKRTIKECIVLFEMEAERKVSKKELKIVVEYLEYLAKWGYFKLKVC